MSLNVDVCYLFIFLICKVINGSQLWVSYGWKIRLSCTKFENLRTKCRYRYRTHATQTKKTPNIARTRHTKTRRFSVPLQPSCVHLPWQANARDTTQPNLRSGRYRRLFDSPHTFTCGVRSNAAAHRNNLNLWPTWMCVIFVAGSIVAFDATECARNIPKPIQSSGLIN